MEEQGIGKEMVNAAFIQCEENQESVISKALWGFAYQETLM